MRALIQRVTQASVHIDEHVSGKIGKGLLIFIGIEDQDTEEDIVWLSHKICALRIFDDAQGIMNNNISEVRGDILLISQFTLHAQTKKGNRPSYIKASKPAHAKPLYEKMIAKLSQHLHKDIATGQFGADMKVHLINDGPVTIWVDSKNKE